MKKLIALATLILCCSLQAAFAQENYPSSQHVFYIEQSTGAVHELLYTSAQGRWTNQNLSAMTGAPGSGPGSGNLGLASFHDSFGIEVFYQSGGQIIELHWNGGWSWQALGGAPAANTPITGFSNSNGEHIYFINNNHDVAEFYFNGSTWGLTPLAHAAGVPAQMSSYADGSNTAHVFYSNGGPCGSFNGGGLIELYYDGSSWHENQLPASSENGFGVAGIWDNNGEEIFYVNGATGTSQLGAAYAYWNPVNGTWSPQTLPGLPSGCFVTGFANSNGEHFYYFSGNHVNEEYFNYGTKSWANYDTSVQTGIAAAAGSNITSFSNSNGQHVYFINTNFSIGEFYYPTNGTHWAYSDILAQTGTGPLGSGPLALSSFSF